jgi:chromate reductase, NAD(P)H dehydrogenase (quinone)
LRSGITWTGCRHSNEDWEADPAPLAVAARRELIADADGLLIATPEYNGSIPGQLKNALDWASRPRGAAVLQGKPAAVISASTSARGAARAAADPRKVLTIAGASVITATLAVPRAFAQFTAERCHVRGTSPASVVASVYDVRA